MDKLTEEQTRITIVLDKDLKKKVVLHCVEEGVTVKDYITNLLKEKFLK